LELDLTAGSAVLATGTEALVLGTVDLDPETVGFWADVATTINKKQHCINKKRIDLN
jgi:hypothetical protein